MTRDLVKHRDIFTFTFTAVSELWLMQQVFMCCFVVFTFDSLIMRDN